MQQKVTGHDRCAAQTSTDFPFGTSPECKFTKGFRLAILSAQPLPQGRKSALIQGGFYAVIDGSFDIVTKAGRVTGISHKYCKAIHKKDGYSYGF